MILKCPKCGKLLGKAEAGSATVILWCKQCKKEVAISFKK